MPRVAGRRRVPSSVSEVGRIAEPRELSAQLEGPRFSLSPGARRDECREGLAAHEAEGCARGCTSSRSWSSSPRRHTPTRVDTHTRYTRLSGLPLPIRTCPTSRLPYVYTDTQSEAEQVNTLPSSPHDETGVVDPSCLTVLHLPAHLPACLPTCLPIL